MRCFEMSRRAALPALLLTMGLLTGCSKEEPTAPSGGSNTASGGSAAPSGGAGSGNTSGKKKIVFVFKVGGNPYSEACKAGAQQANDDPALNANVEYQAPTVGTSEKQIEIINQAVVGKADAIVVSPDDANGVIPALKAATDAGVKVYTWDADAPGSARRFYVTAADDVQIGIDIADALAKEVGEKGKVLIFSGQRTAANLNNHVKGIETGLKKYPGITIAQPYVYNDDDQAKATSMAKQALQANPDTVGIACANSPSPPAAGEALRSGGLVGKVKVWGLALPSATKEYIKDGSVSGLYLWDPQKLTYLTAKLVKDDLDGKAPQDGATIGEAGKYTVKDGQVTLPIRIDINKGNVDTFKF